MNPDGVLASGRLEILRGSCRITANPVEFRPKSLSACHHEPQLTSYKPWPDFLQPFAPLRLNNCLNSWLTCIVFTYRSMSLNSQHFGTHPVNISANPDYTHTPCHQQPCCPTPRQSTKFDAEGLVTLATTCVFMTWKRTLRWLLQNRTDICSTNLDWTAILVAQSI